MDNLVKIYKINPQDYCHAYANTSNDTEMINEEQYNICCGQMMTKQLMKRNYESMHAWNQKVLKIDPIDLGNPIFSYVIQWKSNIDNLVKRRKFNPKDYCELYGYKSNNMELVNEQLYKYCCEQMVAQNLMIKTCNAYSNGWKSIIFKKDDLTGLENPVFSFIKQWKDKTPDNFVRRNNCNPKDYCVVYGSMSHIMELWDVQLYNHCREQMVVKKLMTNDEVVDNWDKTVLEIDPNGLENPIFSYVLQWQCSINTFVKRRNFNPKVFCHAYGNTSYNMELVNEQLYTHCREQMVSQQLINPTVTQDLTNPTVTQNSTNPTVTQNLTNPTVTQNLTTNNEVVHNWNKTVLEIDPNGLENPVSSFIRQWQVHNPFTYVKRNNCNPNDYCVLYGSVSHKMELWDDGMQSLGITCTV